MDQNDQLEQTSQDAAANNADESMDTLASSWPSLTLDERRERFEHLSRTDAEELFLALSPHDQGELLSEAPSLSKRSWVRLLAPDDVADLIQEMGNEHREEILSLLDPQTRREVTVLLAYAEDNAGGLMSSRFVRLRSDMSVDEAISYLRIQARTHVETISYCYVLDNDQRLLGVVSFRELFSASPTTPVKEIMRQDVAKIPVELDQEQIALIFQQRGLLALPVVDEHGHMKGIVTLDDVADTIQEEATEDIQKIGGMETLDAPYMKTPLPELIRKRAGWLSILFLGQMFTATAMAYFKMEIERAVVIALFIPLIISSGGNSGSQASTLIIRAMALGEVRMRDWQRVLWREILTGLALGTLLGAIGFLRILVWPGRDEQYGAHWVELGYTIFCSVVGVVLWGAVTGAMLPFVLRKLKLDPASASAPMVATLVDVTGLIIYFTVASLFLSGLLL